MRKILLLEDRSQRQNDFLKTNNIQLNKYTVLDNKIDEKFISFMLKIKENEFDLNIYDVIIAHQSIFLNENRDVLGKLQNYCKKHKKALVLFSGGNETSYNNEDYEKLDLSSEEFYSKNLILFLEDFEKNNINIRILTFGNQWRLNIILSILEEINIFINMNKKEKVLFNSFKQRNRTFFNNIDTLNLELYNYQIVGNKIYLSEIMKLRDSIVTIIKDLVDE